MPVRIIAGLPDNTIGFVAEGEVTGDDYTSTIDPAVEQALTTNDKVRLLYVLGEDFTGYSGVAMSEDGRLGMTHLTSWERIAVVADQDWIRHTVDVMGHLIPGSVRVFTLAEEPQARAWVIA
ncbi:MAG TPA: STAS/SEC14 domain-containing protein [Euzebyales bacterium]